MRVDSTKVWAVMLEYWYVGVPLNDKGGDTMDITQQYTHNLICHHFAKEKSGRWYDESILLGFMKDVSDTLQHWNHKYLMQRMGYSRRYNMSVRSPFAFISWHIAWLAYTKHTIYYRSRWIWGKILWRIEMNVCIWQIHVYSYEQIHVIWHS